MLKRFPDRNSLISGYSILALLLYSWTFLTFFWKIPSWLFYLTPGEIGVLFAYAMTTAMLESLFWLAWLALASFVLPARILRNEFVARSGWFSLTFFVMLMIYLIPALELQQNVRASISWVAIAFSAALLTTFFLGRLPIMSNLILALAERASVMLYIYLPLSLVCFLIVLIRLLVVG
jgi:hypothetical protein